MDLPPDPVIPPDAPTPSVARVRPRAIIVGLLAVAILALVLVALLALGVIGAGANRSGDPGASPEPSASAAPGFSADGRSIGMAEAAVIVEVWADFQCPFCRLSAHGTEPALVREFAATGQARIVFRDFAFLGQESVDAAVAARCAEQQGRFWRYHDLLFASQAGENQGAFARANLVGLAQFAGLDPATLSACLDDPALADEVAAETAEGRSLRIDSTPTLRIVGPNGSELLTGLNNPTAVAEAIERGGRPAPSGSPAATGTDGAGQTPGASP